jgi:glycerol-3-phosphate dehydrogenase
MTAAAFDRLAMVDRLANETFDVLIVGGGITGAGVALDAATRGLSVALVERDDFSSGTSSKSSKLVHGGLRYLQQGEFRLVYEALRERQRLLKNAPHLVRILPFLIPVSRKGGVVDRKLGWALGKAMWLYDITGGSRIGKLHKKVDAATAARHFGGAKADELAYAYVYYDATVDDSRLVITLARTAAAHGAALANYCKVTRVVRDGQGYAVTVVATVGTDFRREFVVRARTVVNAAGVWADEIRTLAEGTDPDAIRPAKGIHITVPWNKVRNDIAIVIPVPNEKRTLFVVPWVPKPDGTFEYTYVGTTDTDYTGPEDDPQCTPADIAYVLGALNASLAVPLTGEDVTGTWAGLRPLVKPTRKGPGAARTADLSRRHSVVDVNGVITVTGGKLTTYREMAQDAVNEVCTALGRTGLKSVTDRTPLVGAEGYTPPEEHSERAHLDRRYGTERATIDALIASDPSLGEPVVPGLPYVLAEVIYACRDEMAVTLDDVLSRRTRVRLQARDASVGVAPAMAQLMAAELGWDAARQATEVRAYADSIAVERIESGLPATLIEAI